MSQVVCRHGFGGLTGELRWFVKAGLTPAQANKVPHRDRILTLRAPFAGEPVEVARTEYRFGGAAFTDNGTILLTENDRASRTTRTWVLNPSWGQPRKLWDRKLFRSPLSRASAHINVAGSVGTHR